MNAETLRLAFKTRFTLDPEIFVRAPGRINLIGEHTDYNNGFVLPAAIDKAIWLAAGKRSDGRFAFHALDLNESFLSDSDLPIFQEQHRWANYLLGVVSEARKDGLHFGGLNLVFGGDVPLGAGLSSSAALESGAMFLINELYDLGLSKMELVRLAQRGENNFVGMQCGIMDMFASVMGHENAVVRLDCRSLEFAYFPFDAPGYELVLCDSSVKHALVDSEYNTRRSECEEGVSILQQFDPNIQSLRDVQIDWLKEHRDHLREVVFRRCAFVVEEIHRVELACNALQEHDLIRFGELMFQTHAGLQYDYEVSCPELDFLVGLARANSGVAGARMMGGGFGGCSINLIKSGAASAFLAESAAAYKQKFGKTLKIYPVRLSAGTERVAG